MSQRADEELLRRWLVMRPFVLVGALSIVAGGLVAAVTGPTGFEDGSWVAGYLVLVAGVAQVGLGAGQALLSTRPPTHLKTIWELLAWNAGSVAVLAGTLTGVAALVLLGGVALFGGLVLFMYGVGPARAARGALMAYRLLAGLLAVSIPVGLVLSVMNHS